MLAYPAVNCGDARAIVFDALAADPLAGTGIVGAGAACKVLFLPAIHDRGRSPSGRAIMNGSFLTGKPRPVGGELHISPVDEFSIP